MRVFTPIWRHRQEKTLQHNNYRFYALRLNLLVSASLAALAGCAARQASTPAPISAPIAVAPSPPPVPSVTPTTAPPPAETFKPYTVLPTLPPKPKTAARRHKTLHLAQYHRHYYLTDDHQARYDVGRDDRGDLYPVYHERESNQDYPLYYDEERDRYYRVVRDEEKHCYYRGYVDDPSDRLYDDPDAGEDTVYKPARRHRPTIDAPHHDSNRDAWLLAIPELLRAITCFSRAITARHSR